MWKLHTTSLKIAMPVPVFQCTEVTDMVSIMYNYVGLGRVTPQKSNGCFS